jgi:hypothetical protein
MATLVVMVGKITPKGTSTVILHGALNGGKKDNATQATQDAGSAGDGKKEAKPK